MKTEWFGVDGGMSCGKSVIIRRLRRKGFRMICEAARSIIVEGRRAGKPPEETRRDEQAFQKAVLARKIAMEAGLPPSERIGFDRGRGSSIAYNRVYGYDDSKSVEAALAVRYRLILILEPLPLVVDYARIDFKIAPKLHALIIHAYQDVGYKLGEDLITVPVFTEDKWENIRRRVKFIEEQIKLRC